MNGEVKFFFVCLFCFFWGGGSGGHGRCEQRSEVFVKIKKKWGDRVGGRVGGSGWMCTKN